MSPKTRLDPFVRQQQSQGREINANQVATARQRGILVSNTPGVLTDDTADMTMALMLAVLQVNIRAGQFPPAVSEPKTVVLLHHQLPLQSQPDDLLGKVAVPAEVLLQLGHAALVLLVRAALVLQQVHGQHLPGKLQALAPPSPGDGRGQP